MTLRLYASRVPAERAPASYASIQIIARFTRGSLSSGDQLSPASHDSHTSPSDIPVTTRRGSGPVYGIPSLGLAGHLTACGAHKFARGQ